MCVNLSPKATQMTASQVPTTRGSKTKALASSKAQSRGRLLSLRRSYLVQKREERTDRPTMMCSVLQPHRRQEDRSQFEGCYWLHDKWAPSTPPRVAGQDSFSRWLAVGLGRFCRRVALSTLDLQTELLLHRPSPLWTAGLDPARGGSLLPWFTAVKTLCFSEPRPLLRPSSRPRWP